MGALLHVRGILLSFLRTLFGRRPVGAYRWDSDPAVSEILITSEMPIAPEVFHARPALAIARGPVAFQHLGFDDFDSYDPATQTETKTTLISGVVILIGLSRVLLESERLAMFCASSMLAYREQLQRQGRFFDFGQASGISAPSQAGSIVSGDRGDSVVATSVNFPFTLPWTCKITPLNQNILEGVDGALHLHLPESPGSSTKMPYPAGKTPPADLPVFTFPSSPFGSQLPSTPSGVASSSQPNPVIRFGV